MVRLGAVGDLVRTLPALHLLRQSWPETRIAWVVEEHLAPLLAGHPQIDAVFTIDRHGFLEEARRWSPKALGRIARLRGELRAFEPELAIDFQGCLKSGLASWLSGARVRLCFEREEVRERSHLFSNVRVPLPDRDRHRVRRALALARASGAGSASDEAAEDIPRVDLAFSVAERRRGRELQDRFGGVGRTVAIAPFTSRRQHWKRYPADRWRKVASDLAARDYSVLLIAGPGEEQEAHQLARDCGPGVGVCEGLELRELAAVLAGCDLLIGGDTGPMHMAWAVGTKVVAVYGPTLPALNSPVGEGHAWLAPDQRTDRDAADKFPGITPESIVESSLGVLEGRGVRLRTEGSAVPALNGHARSLPAPACSQQENGQADERDRRPGGGQAQEMPGDLLRRNAARAAGHPLGDARPA
jgi:lipopolysaccharide heptosyltransferase I